MLYRNYQWLLCPYCNGVLLDKTPDYRGPHFVCCCADKIRAAEKEGGQCLECRCDLVPADNLGECPSCRVRVVLTTTKDNHTFWTCPDAVKKYENGKAGHRLLTLEGHRTEAHLFIDVNSREQIRACLPPLPVEEMQRLRDLTFNRSRGRLAEAYGGADYATWK